MSDEQSPTALKHILVALDASPHSRAALDAAVKVAAAFEAEVHGLFVEDETLLRAAQLPFSHEVRAYTTSPKQLSNRRVQRQMRYQSEYAEHTLQYAAEEAEVAYEFETVQGRVTHELLRAAAETDLLVLGKTSTDSSRRRLGSTSQTVLAEAASSVLVVRETVPVQKPILTYYDGSDTADGALRMAVQLAQRGGPRPLTVLLPGEDEAEATRLREDVQNRYGADVPLTVRVLTSAESRRLSAVARRSGGLVVLPADCAPLAHVPLKQFLYEIDRPLLVVR